jgi:hypothetical protein
MMKGYPHTSYSQFLLVTLTGFLLLGCSVSRKAYSPLQKFPPAALRSDFDILQDVLEKFHPSLYAYTPKSTIDFAFERYRNAISDSMTEQQFAFHIVSPVITQIRCGHTTLSLSKQYLQYFRNISLPSFPLYLKVWKDTMMVTRNLHKNDSLLKKGTQITSINGMNVEQIKNILFRFLPTDGFADNINYIRLSTAFPYYYRNILGLEKEYLVGFIDSSFQEQIIKTPCFFPEPDTGRINPSNIINKEKKVSTAKYLNNLSIKYDTLNACAIMNIPSFDRPQLMKRFYRHAFNNIKSKKIRSLVIDVRNNGGGNVDNQVQLTRYLKPHAFRVTDTAAAIRQSFKGYRKVFNNEWGNELVLRFLTSRKQDGKYHLRYWENHVFKPKKSTFFHGQIYLITGGPTFSAASLFCNSLKSQQNVSLIGEETGGGQYSNNGLLIPSVTLPNTQTRIRVPLFRMVPDKNAHNSGKGVMPDIPVYPTAESVRKGNDIKLEMVMSLIKARNTHKIPN